MGTDLETVLREQLPDGEDIRSLYLRMKITRNRHGDILMDVGTYDSGFIFMVRGDRTVEIGPIEEGCLEKARAALDRA